MDLMNNNQLPDWISQNPDEKRLAEEMHDLFTEHVPESDIHPGAMYIYKVVSGRVVIFVPEFAETFWFEGDRIFRMKVTPDGPFVTTFKNGERFDPPGSKN